MPRYKAPSIKDQGGLKAYLTSMGVDYDLYKQCRSQLSNAAIGRLLARQAHKQKPFKGSTIKHWNDIDDEETNGKS